LDSSKRFPALWHVGRDFDMMPGSRDGPVGVNGRLAVEVDVEKGSESVMHYPHKISKVKRARKIGFRARMKTPSGRKIINAKRRAGRRVQVV